MISTSSKFGKGEKCDGAEEIEEVHSETFPSSELEAGFQPRKYREGDGSHRASCRGSQAAGRPRVSWDRVSVVVPLISDPPLVTEVTSDRRKSWLHEEEIQSSWHFISFEVTGRLGM